MKYYKLKDGSNMFQFQYGAIRRINVEM